MTSSNVTQGTRVAFRSQEGNLPACGPRVSNFDSPTYSFPCVANPWHRQPGSGLRGRRRTGVRG
eukprot:9111557-Pyramimonas_sp.AAC.1